MAGWPSGPAELESCPSCYEWKPLSEFCDLNVGLSPDDPLPSCLACRTNGRPRPQFLNLSRRHRKALEILIAAPNLPKGISAAARATGYSQSSIRDLINGRRTPEFRRAFQVMLEAGGADLMTVARVIGEALRANDYKYHSALEDFVHFPDHRTRLRAAQTATKLLELEPPNGYGVQIGVGVQIKHNLGAGETIEHPSVFRAFPVKESP